MNKLIARSIYIGNKKTSIKLENYAWESLQEIAEREKCSVHEICTTIFENRQDDLTLSCAVRTFILLYFKAAATEVGHINAGHGTKEIKKQVTDYRLINKQQSYTYDDFVSLK